MKAPAQNAAEKTSPAAPTVTARGPHHRVWQRDHFVTLPDGRVVNRPSGYTELATGLHYLDHGAWKESRAEIEITPEGAAALHGPHQVRFAGNLNTRGAISLTTPDQKILRSHVIGLAYTDTATAQSVFLGRVRDAEGLLYAPNEVVYPNAFSGVRADVRYTYSRQGFEQDVILRANLPAPDSVGMNAETTLLEVWTEFVESPEPAVQFVSGPGGRKADQELEFGTVRILRGHAFALDAPLSRMSAAPVVKQWVQAGTQRYLIESVRYSTILPELEKLPPHQAGLRLPAQEKNSRLALLQKIKPLETRPATPVRLAVLPFQRQQGLVLDYVLYQGDRTNVTFQADTTYLLTDGFNVYGTTTLEGGTVIKYNTSNDVVMQVWGEVVCATDDYRPAIFTSRNDRTVGEDLYDGTPMQFHAAMAVDKLDLEFKHLRISHAWRGLQTYGAKVRHAQFVHCDTAFATYYTLFEEWGAAEFDNILIYDTRVAFGGALYSNVVRQATVHQCDALTADGYGYPSELYLTNSLLVNVTNWGVGGYFTNAVVNTTNAAALQTVGAGAHYLATGSTYRHAGTTNIPAALLAELRRRTTYPPVVITNATLSTNLTLSSTAPRSTNAPGLGYHYAPLDYVFGSNVLTNATLTLRAGTALGTFTPGSNTHALLLTGGSSVIARGEPTNLVHVVRYNVVQEQAGQTWSSTTAGASVRSAAAWPAPRGDFRFTAWSVPSGEPLHGDFTSTNAAPFLFRDSQFSGGRFRASAAQVTFTNNLLERVNGYCLEHPLTVTNHWFNNTFVGGAWTFYNSGNGPWKVFNNAFVGTADLSSDAGLPHGWNAYLPGAPFVCGWLSNGIVTNIVFQSGRLGRHYLTNSSPLLNRGSMSAGSAGLYHYTTATNQTPETNTTVDMGFHYLALTSTSANAGPPDTDGDGVPDYVEDANGNGTREAEETSATRSDSPFLPRDYEPLGPSSRRTPLVISEIMYHPASGFQFIELYNTHHLTQDLSGFTFSIKSFPFPYPLENTLLPPSSFLSVPFGTLLNTSGDTVQLRNRAGAVVLEVAFKNEPPWPKEADSAGHSLVLARPSYGENDPRAWAASERRGGSPGYAETNRVDFLRAIKINEFLALGTNASDPDFIELYNASNQAIDLSGCTLSEAAGNLIKFPIPDGTVLEPRGFKLYRKGESGSFTFELNGAGDQIYLTSPEQARVIDVVDFKTQEAGVSAGRVPDGSPNIVALSSRTPGASNSPALARSIVINEVMYHPISENDDDEFVEIYNSGTNSVNLHNWTVSGAISLTITNFTLAPSKYLVLAGEPTLLRSKYPTNQLVISSNLFRRGWTNDLSNGGENITLKSSGGVIMDEVTYSDGGRWGRWADGGGSSLELLDPRSDNRQAANWADSLPLTSAAWTSLSVTGIVQLGDANPPAALELMMLGAGECLVDDVEVIDAGGVNRVGNGSFDSACLTVLTNEAATCTTNAGSCWIVQGTHELSEIQTNGGTTNGPALLVRTTGRGDYLANRIVTCWSTALSTGSTCIIRAKVKWLRGQPELVFRLRGGFMEGVAHMTTVAGGTPGRTNSAGLTNAPPALWDVTHFPVVPVANELVTITARAHDSHGVTNFVLKYRLDASTSYTALAMRDDGTGGDALAGDGLSSAVLPAQTGGTVIAFLVEATDSLGATARFPKAEKLFPGDTFQREAVVHYGDGQPSGTFGTYRLWLTAASYNQWAGRNRVHNSLVDATFVYGSSRAIYNAGAKYSGTVWSSKTYYNTPIGALCGYALDFPGDDRFLGATGAGLDYDNSNPRYMVSEQLALGLAERLELPNNYRRFHHLYVRGVHRTSTAVYEDAQQPNSDFLAEWYPDQDAGELFKLEFWWGMADVQQPLIGYKGALLQRHNRTWPGTTNTSLDIAGRYRLTWLPRAVMIAIHVMTGTEAVGIRVVDHALQHERPHPLFLINLADHVGLVGGQPVRIRGHDQIGKAPVIIRRALHLANGLRWQLLTIDFDGVFRYDGTNFTPDPFRELDNDSALRSAMLPHPPFRRAQWRCLYDLANPVDGLLLTNTIWPVFFGGVNALLANGFTVPSTASTNSPQNFIATQQPYLWNRLAEVRPVQAILSPASGSTVTASNVTLTGVAPVEVRGFKLNGTVAANLSWTTVSNWSLTVPLVTGSNFFQLTGYDRKTNALPVRDKGGYTNSLHVFR